MPSTVVFPIIPSLSGWSLAGTLRNINDAGGSPTRIELAPRSVLADAECDTTQSWSTGGVLGSWNIANTGNLSSLDENTTLKSHLFAVPTATASDYFGSTINAPFFYQSITGDFDIYVSGRFVDADYSGLMLGVQKSDLSANYAHISLLHEACLHRLFRYTVSGTSTDADSAIGADTGQTGLTGAKQPMFGLPFFVRLKSSSGTISGYYSFDGKTWTQQGSSIAMTLGSPANVGIIIGNPLPQTTLGNQCAAVDFIRNWPPYDTTGPSASVVIDSGFSGTTWTMSTFAPLINPYMEFAPYSQIGFGTLAYQYGASDSNPPSLNGTWLSASSMTGQSNPTGRYFKLAVQFNSANGYQLASFAGANISASISAGGGGSSLNRGVLTGGGM